MSTTDLVIGGMTCASCATRVEKKLNRLDGVTATVNLATETARVSFPGSLQVADLIAVVERTGYTAALPAPPAAGAAGNDADTEGGASAPRRPARCVALALGRSPVMVLGRWCSPPSSLSWQWVSLALAVPVVTWGPGRST